MIIWTLTNEACLLVSMKCKTYGIDVNALARDQYTGVEKYVFELISEMMKKPLFKNERVFLYSSREILELGQLPTNWHWKILKLPILSKGWTHLCLSFELLVNPPDVFFSPAHEIPLFFRKAKIVNTIHDVAFIHVPEVYSFFARLRQKWAIKRTIKLSDKLISVSETTKRDLVGLFDVESEKITVATLGVKKRDYVQKLEPLEYFLTLGRVESKKNILFLLEAFEQFALSNLDMKLVLAGKMGEGSQLILDKINSSGVKDRIIVLGYVPSEGIDNLIMRSRALLFPSKYEGFGLPALEAMSLGTLVIASDIPALREVCGDCALFASPDNTDEWLKAMNSILDDSVRQDLVLRGCHRVGEFEWQATAQKTLKILRSV